LLVAAEYSRTHLDYETNEPGLDPLLFEETMGPPYPRHDTNYYAMVSYRVTDWFTPGVYYSSTRPYEELPREQHRYRRDFAAFVRYDLNAHWLLKLEGHYFDGTAGLDPELNDLDGEEQLDTLKRRWGAFLVKTTGYF
jgi:predicted porin